MNNVLIFDLSVYFILFLFVSVFLSYVFYNLYNVKNVKDKFIKRVYSDRYHMLLVLMVGMISFGINYNKYKYIPLFIILFIIIELVHVILWDDQGQVIGSSYRRYIK